MEVAEETIALFFTVLWPEDGDSSILRNAGRIISGHEAPYINVSIFHRH
jgi:hypothetical protein